jgi:beta-glucosidase-like glycosyl hydrolase
LQWLKFKASTSSAVGKREAEHLKLVRELAPQCMVLLENDGALPLKAGGRVALFGAAPGAPSREERVRGTSTTGT